MPIKYDADTLVSAVMESPVRTVEARSTLREAAEALRDLGMGTLVIMDRGDVAGILSERDVVQALADGADPDQIWVGDIMSEEPRYLTTASDARSALEVMIAAGIRHLPVVEEGELIGIVSMRDLVRTLLG